MEQLLKMALILLAAATAVRMVRKKKDLIVAVVIKRKCSLCKDRYGTLFCDNGMWICEHCAQIQSELAP